MVCFERFTLPKDYITELIIQKIEPKIEET